MIVITKEKANAVTAYKINTKPHLMFYTQGQAEQYCKDNSLQYTVL